MYGDIIQQYSSSKSIKVEMTFIKGEIINYYVINYINSIYMDWWTKQPEFKIDSSIFGAIEQHEEI